MARILALDYGGKRTGVAVTDPLQIIAQAIDTIDTTQLWIFLKKYFSENEVELVIMGLPVNWDDTDTDATPLVRKAMEKFHKEFPNMPLEMVDERYTSKMASDAMVAMGMKKKDRRKKGSIDQIAATIMLQEYLNR